MLDIASYVTLSNGASDGLHNPVSGYFWWSWNANSGEVLDVMMLRAAVCSCTAHERRLPASCSGLLPGCSTACAAAYDARHAAST